MKNLSKILAVVLTLALIAGLIVSAVPVSAKVTPQETHYYDTWGNADEYPDVVMGTQSDIYTVAADGTTMFMWTNTTTSLAKATTLGDTIVYVASTDGFPSAGGAVITGQIPFKYTAKTPTSFTGCTNVPTAVIATVVGPFVGAGLPAGTTTTGVLNVIGATTLTVASTAGYPAAGVLTVNVAGALQETVTYSAVASPTTFTVTALTKNHAAAVPVVLASGTAANAAAVYKSTDAGLTWSAASLTAPAIAVGAAITQIKVCPTDLNQLVATDGTSLYRSINGGKNWATGIAVGAGSPIDATAAAINSVDIAVNSDGNVVLLVGTDVGVAYFDAALGVWKNTTAATFGALWIAGDNAKIAVFSPDFANDNQVLAVASGAVNTNLVNYVIGDTNWNGTVGAGLIGAIPAAGTSACVAFPNNYSWGTNNQVFVGITDALALGDVYRVTGKLGLAATVKDCGLDADVASVAVSGTKADSIVIASQTGVGIAISDDADTASAPAWTTDGIKSPYGVSSKLFLASTGILYAGNANGNNSMFYYATPDFKSFNGQSRFEVSNVYVATYSRGVLSEGRNQPGFWFYKTAAGTLEMRLSAERVAPSGGFAENPGGVRGSSTVYAIKAVAPKQIWKSSDAGLTWTQLSSPGNKTETTIAVVSDTEYWIGYADAGSYIRSNTGAAIAVGSLTQNPGDIWFVGKTGILVGLNKIAMPVSGNRINTTYAWSNDSGATWKVLEQQDKWLIAQTFFYNVANKTIYITDAAGVLWTWDLMDAEQTLWAQEDALTGVTDLAAIKAFTITSEVMFVGTKPAAAGNSQVFRSLPGKSVDFRAYPNSTTTSFGAQLDGLSVYDNANNTFNVKVTLANFVATAPLPAGNNFGRVRLYTDQTIGALTLTSPAEGAELNNPVDLSWNKSAQSGKIDYQYQIARDAEFDLIQNDVTNNNTNQLSVGGGALTTGQKYYWRARVNNTWAAGVDNELTSFWSDVRSFTVKTIGTVNAAGIGQVNSVYPPQGEINISTKPVLTWGVVAGATYNVKIAKDSAFTNIVEEKQGLTVAVYQPSKALDANTVYFWEVQAVSGGIASDWVAFAFTTAAPAVPVATGPATVAPPVVQPTIVIPTQPQPTFTVITGGDTTPPATPAYIWFIIVIGAVLVIAVIVLIVRTRRV